MRSLLCALLLAVPLAASAESILDQLSGTPGFERSSRPPFSVDPDPGGGETPDPGGAPPTTPVPVDGGLTLLALAGAGYAAKKLRQRTA